MTTVAELFPSKYVAAADLKGAPVTVNIERATIEPLNGKNKLILWFTGCSKGLMLNKTNAKVIAKMHGEEVERWMGKAITIYPSECEFKGDLVPCIRVKSAVALMSTAQPEEPPQMTVQTPTDTPQNTAPPAAF